MHNAWPMRLSYGQVVQEKQATLHLHNGVTAAQEVVTGFSNGETCLSARRAFELFEVLEGRKVQFAGDSRGQVRLGCRLCGILRSHRVLASASAERTDDGRTDGSRTRVPPSRPPSSILSGDLVFPFPPLSLPRCVSPGISRRRRLCPIRTGTRTDDGTEMASLFLGP